MEAQFKIDESRFYTYTLTKLKENILSVYFPVFISSKGSFCRTSVVYPLCECFFFRAFVFLEENAEHSHKKCVLSDELLIMHKKDLFSVLCVCVCVCWN